MTTSQSGGGGGLDLARDRGSPRPAIKSKRERNGPENKVSQRWGKSHNVTRCDPSLRCQRGRLGKRPRGDLQVQMFAFHSEGKAAVFVERNLIARQFEAGRRRGEERETAPCENLNLSGATPRYEFSRRKIFWGAAHLTFCF